MKRLQMTVSVVQSLKKHLLGLVQRLPIASLCQQLEITYLLMRPIFPMQHKQRLRLLVTTRHFNKKCGVISKRVLIVTLRNYCYQILLKHLYPRDVFNKKVRNLYGVILCIFGGELALVRL